MKELSTEQKAKRYDEAFERAKLINSGEGIVVEEGTSICEAIFPELKESEDEKIRKAQLDYWRSVGGKEWYGVPVQETIAWLEKQGRKTHQTPQWMIDFLDKNRSKFASLMGDYDEQREAEGKLLAIIDWLEKQKSIDSLTAQEAMDIAVAKCFEQSEQKPTKVEPKFHEGDWTVSNLDKKARQISEVHFDEYNSYYMINGKSVNLKEYDRLHRLWTIQDAKDGDVLCCENGWMCIFKTLVNDETFSSYCFMDKTKWFYETGSECHTLKDEFVKAYNGEIHPATKEQRDTLMKAMHDAGYEFDFEKKELKKIEQKPVMIPKFKIGDKIKHKEWGNIAIIKSIESERYRCTNGAGLHFEYQDNWELVEQTPAWSEEDDYNLQCMIAKVTSDIQKGNVGRNNELIDWLKSLRPQKRWKPSEEQMKALEITIKSVIRPGFEEKGLTSLLEQLKAL